MILNVGEIVKQCRKKMKWSQEELAFNTNLSQSTVSRLEKNKITCDVNTLMQIANKTNAQDILMAMMFNIDMGLVTQVLQLVPTFIGGMFTWIL
ncbi:helix-turn-helix domain-containing protein [Lysinibacillus sp. UGB7]|uniref:helix-turn-helix domain-containing protein n=1 Tax=Lysinibacillus sp. UGB7 TaxID=3411039 RepID=UPI003B78C6BE